MWYDGLSKGYMVGSVNRWALMCLANPIIIALVMGRRGTSQAREKAAGKQACPILRDKP